MVVRCGKNNLQVLEICGFLYVGLRVGMKILLYGCMCG